MVHFGFSYVGLAFIAMLLIPNFIWAKNKPADYDRYVGNENRFLLILERIGEAGNMVLALVFADFNIRPFTLWSLWLVAAALLMVLYELYWIRYFRSGKTMADMYSSFAGFPVAGASLPCIAFFCLGIYGSNIFLIVSTIILSIGHIGIHIGHRNEVVPKAKKNKAFAVIRTIVLIPVTVILLVIIIAIAGRNINWFSHYIDTSEGINETCYVNIGGQEQYLLIRGKDINNPVILYIHGGPGGPDSPIAGVFTEPFIDDYTVVCWDQRGCGRTYFRNESVDPMNETVDFETAVSDTDELVEYLLERFDTDKVILMCHSYGTVVGTAYIQEHGDKVAAYIGIGQFIDYKESEYLSYEDALVKAKAAGDDTKALEDAYDLFLKGDSFTNIMKLRGATSQYHVAKYSADTIMLALFSPYTGVDDIRWVLKQMDMDNYYLLEQDLMDTLFEIKLYDNNLTYDVPMLFVSGDCDYVCNYTLAQQYCEDISAPAKEFVLMEGCGHAPQYAMPDEFGANVKSFLSGVLVSSEG